MAGPERKENQFRLPDDFFKIDITILSYMSHPITGFPLVSHNTDRSPFSDGQKFTRQARSKTINNSTLTGRDHLPSPSVTPFSPTTDWFY